jgi:AraC-like DNA-binding protein
MADSRPLDSFPLVRTSKIEELEDSLGRIIAKPALKLVGRDTPLRAIQNNCQLQHIGLNYGLYGTEIGFRFPEPTIYSQIFSIRGTAEALIEGTSVTIDPHCSAVVSADVPFDMTCDADYERLNLNIRVQSLTDKLVAITGQSKVGPLRMAPAQTFRQPAAVMLRRNVMFFVNQLSASASLPSLLLAELEQMILVMFLYANHHNYSHLLGRPAPGVSALQVRRAEEYIEANWNKPIELEDIAAAAGVGFQSLSQMFRRIRGCSPMEFAKQVRLRRAREQLQRLGEATTVAAVARACGFHDLERFREAYLKAFGELPSETLNGGKAAGPARH